MQDLNRPTCPTCLKPMARSGTVLSGRRRCQRYKCSWCGYVKVDTSREIVTYYPIDKAQ